MRHHLVLRVVSRALIPVILLFALYVQFHGDFGPGGGFQAGVIFGAAFVLFGIVAGLDNARSVLPSRVVVRASAAGLMLYALVGVVSLLRGGKFLEYGVLGSTQTAGQHLGILLVELGVGITVAAVMIGLFYAFTDQASAGR